MSMHLPPLFITTALYTAIVAFFVPSRRTAVDGAITPDTGDSFERNKTMAIQPTIDACVGELMRHAIKRFQVHDQRGAKWTDAGDRDEDQQNR
jgi:hypothetical protein